MNHVYLKEKTEFKPWSEIGCLVCRDQRGLEMTGNWEGVGGEGRSSQSSPKTQPQLLYFSPLSPCGDTLSAPWASSPENRSQDKWFL